MGLPLKKSDRTRLKLLAALRQELEASGDFSAERVARRAGSSPATFYNHFDSKDEAFDAAYQLLMDELVAQVERGLQIDRVLELGLKDFAVQWVQGCVRFFRSNSVLFRTAQAKSSSSPVIQKIYSDAESRAIQHCERFVRLGQAAQLFRTDDPQQMARAMMITSEGYHNPAVLDMTDGDPLMLELARVLCCMLDKQEIRE